MAIPAEFHPNANYEELLALREHAPEEFRKITTPSLQIELGLYESTKSNAREDTNQ